MTAGRYDDLHDDARRVNRMTNGERVLLMERLAAALREREEENTRLRGIRTLLEERLTAHANARAEIETLRTRLEQAEELLRDARPLIRGPLGWRMAAFLADATPPLPTSTPALQPWQQPTSSETSDD